MRLALFPLALFGCHGGTEPEPVSAPLELSIVEFQASPISAGGPWIELVNGREESVTLAGLELEVGSVSLTLDPDAELAPGVRWVVGTTDASDAGIPVDWISDELVIDPSGTTFTLFQQGVELQFLETDGTWPRPVGASLSLHPGHDPAAPDGWCDAWSVGEGGDFGTPGAPNDPCSCNLPFDFVYVSPSGPASDISGSEVLQLSLDGSFAAGGDSGTFERWTDATGQHLEWEYPSTGIVYRGHRPFGTGPFTDQPIEIPPELAATATSGSWTATGPCQ